MKIGSTNPGGLILLVGFIHCDAGPVAPFYRVGDTWKYDYTYTRDWMGTISLSRARSWFEITSVEVGGDTIEYSYRKADSAISPAADVTAGTPFIQEEEGRFGYANGDYFSLTSPVSMGMTLFSTPLKGMKGFKVEFGVDTLEFRQSGVSWDSYEFLEAWGPVHWLSRATGGHTANTWEWKLLEHNGVTFDRSGLIILDTLHVGIRDGGTGKSGSGRKGWSNPVQVFRGRAVDGRFRDKK